VDHSLKPAQANSCRDSISKITKAKWNEGVAQAVQQLLCKHKAQCSNPIPQKTKQNKNNLQEYLHELYSQIQVPPLIGNVTVLVTFPLL
jgi:hypothetical protein